jgi:hypothetical protein
MGFPVTRTKYTSYRAGGEFVVRAALAANQSDTVFASAILDYTGILCKMSIEPGMAKDTWRSTVQWNKLTPLRILSKQLVWTRDSNIGGSIDDSTTVFSKCATVVMESAVRVSERLNSDETLVLLVLPKPSTFLCTVTAGAAPTVANNEAYISFDTRANFWTSDLGSGSFLDASPLQWDEINIKQFIRPDSVGNISQGVLANGEYVWTDLTNPMAEYAGLLTRGPALSASEGLFTSSIFVGTGEDYIGKNGPRRGTYRKYRVAFRKVTGIWLPEFFSEIFFSTTFSPSINATAISRITLLTIMREFAIAVPWVAIGSRD